MRAIAGPSGGLPRSFQVFGEGFPQNLEFRSHIMDFQRTKSLNAVSWEADVPPGTRLELRSRSGNEVENLLTYYDKNGKEVTQRRYDKLIPSFKGPIGHLPSHRRRLERVEQALRLLRPRIPIAFAAPLTPRFRCGWSRKIRRWHCNSTRSV